jgi:primosomal replication protein N
VTKGFGKARHLNIALVNRVRSRCSIILDSGSGNARNSNYNNIHTGTRINLSGFAASHPTILLQKDSIISQAFIKLADTIIEHNAKG